VNYSSVLIWRAETACEGGQVEQALSYVDEANKLLHPATQVPVMSAEANLHGREYAIPPWPRWLPRYNWFPTLLPTSK
jgi:hypothetical protein